MDLQSLRYFVAVAEEGSFTEGARRAHVVQSAASAAVARLERELGTDLFTRTRPGIELTEAGRLLLVRARTMIGEARAARDEINALNGGLRGTVTIGTILTTGPLDLAECVRRFRIRHPEVQVRMRLSARSAYDHFTSVLDGSFDLLIAPMPPILPRGIRMRAVGETRIVPVCGTDHPLAGTVRVSCAELAAHPHIDFPVGWGNRDLIDAIFHDRGIERSLAVEVFDVATALTLAAGGAGVAFVPEPFAGPDRAVVGVDLATSFPLTMLGLASAADRPLGGAARELRDALYAAAAAGGVPSGRSDQLGGQPEVEVEIPERRAGQRSPPTVTMSPIGRTPGC